LFEKSEAASVDLVALVDRMRALPTETEWLDFKRNHVEPEQLGAYVSALANEARLCNQPRGYLLFGIDDRTHDVVGTRFDPYATKARGNQDLLPWLAAFLAPNPGLEVLQISHPEGRVLLLAVGPARDRPVTFMGKASCRAGTSTTELHRHPEKERSLWTRATDWSFEWCPGARLIDLDPEAIAKAREQFIVKHPAKAAAVMAWDDETFLNKARVLRQAAVTNTAMLLLGRGESATLLSPSVAKISWVLKDAANRELDYEHIGPPFLLAGDRLLKRLRNLTVRALPSGTLFPQEMSQYDPWVIRETLHNAIAHQDYLRQARITVVESPERLLVTNVGAFLPGDVDTVIRQDAPQAIYRNPFLADAMVELNLIDTQGGGIKRMYETQRRRSFPLPDFDLMTHGQVSVTLPGQVLDERYTRLLMERSDLDLNQVLLLDRVQKGRLVSREEHRLLKATGLVDGRYPGLRVAGAIGKAADEAERHIDERGFEQQHNLDLIIALLRQHPPATREEIDHLLMSKMPDRMTPLQKQRKVHNMLQELRRAGRIENRGSRARPVWHLAGGKAPRG
jgi:ATP-dependent DNA helicase RecG